MNGQVKGQPMPISAKDAKNASAFCISFKKLAVFWTDIAAAVSIFVLMLAFLVGREKDVFHLKVQVAPGSFFATSILRKEAAGRIA